MTDWQTIYERDEFVRLRHKRMDEVDEAMAYEMEQRATHYSEMNDREFAKEVLGDSYSDLSGGK